MSGSDTISDAVIGGAGEGAIGDAVGASRRRRRERATKFPPPTPPGQCSNCETRLAGPVCHSCGQSADHFHRPIWELIADVIDGLFGLEGRLWRTLPALVFKPGHLTRSYLSGVRARYVMPFRLYLTASVLFFFAFFALDALDSGGLNIDAGSEPVLSEAQLGETLEEVERELAEAGISPDQRARISEVVEAVGREGSTARPTDEAGPVEDAGEADPATPTGEGAGELQSDPSDPAESFIQGMIDGFAEPEDGDVLERRAREISEDGGERLFAEMKRWAPRLMFALLPVYALILAVTHFYKRGFYYYDHLVVSLHFHAFLFFAFLLMLPVNALFGIGWVLLILFLWTNFYLYRIHRRVYQCGRFSSVVRTMFVDFVYLNVLSIAFLALFLIGIFSV
ncbi:DUF3667 domain-containing protein [Maricaulis sp. CAU 1757]